MTTGFRKLDRHFCSLCSQRRRTAGCRSVTRLQSLHMGEGVLA